MRCMILEILYFMEKFFVHNFRVHRVVLGSVTFSVPPPIYEPYTTYRKLLLSHGSNGGGLTLQVPILVPFPSTLYCFYRTDDGRSDTGIRFFHRLHLLFAQTTRGPYAVRPWPPLQRQIQGRVFVCNRIRESEKLS